MLNPGLWTACQCLGSSGSGRDGQHKWGQHKVSFTLHVCLPQPPAWTWDLTWTPLGFLGFLPVHLASNAAWYPTFERLVLSVLVPYERHPYSDSKVQTPMITWSMAFMMTSKKSGHVDSGFKLLWQMICVWLTAGGMWVCYVLLKGFGWTTERNATTLPRPGKCPCCAVGQAESFLGKADGRWHFLWKSWEGEKAVGRSIWWAEGTSSFGQAGALQQSRKWDMQQGASPRCQEGTGKAGCNWRSWYNRAGLSLGLMERTYP